MPDLVLRVRPVVEGRAAGEVLASRMPLSFWGGVDPAEGTVIDRQHDLCGQRVAGRVLVIPGARGSSSSSAVMLEMIRRGTAPAAIVCLSAEPILVVGSLIGRHLYGRWVPVATVDSETFDRAAGARWIALGPGPVLRVRAGA